YGYAQVAKQEREQWQKLIEDYLIHSRQLRVVVIIVDIRRGPEEEEEALCNFLSYHQRPFVIVATKCDKLKRGQLEQQRKALAAQLDGQPLILFSAQDGSGKEELWRALQNFASANRWFPSAMPKVSVLIPTYNRRDFVREAIASVLAQTYRDFELLVIDDGSDDDTATIVQEFDGVRYVFQPNRGVSAARNCGMTLSTGALLAFLDSDDLWQPR